MTALLPKYKVGSSNVAAIWRAGNSAIGLRALTNWDVIPYEDHDIRLPSKVYETIILLAELDNGQKKTSSYQQGLLELKNILFNPVAFDARIVLVSVLPSSHPEIKRARQDLGVEFWRLNRMDRLEDINRGKMTYDERILKSKNLIKCLLREITGANMHGKGFLGVLSLLPRLLELEQFSEFNRIQDSIHSNFKIIEKCLTTLKVKMADNDLCLHNSIFNRKHESFHDLKEVVLNRSPEDSCLPCFKAELRESIKVLITNYFSKDCDFYKYFDND